MHALSLAFDTQRLAEKSEELSSDRQLFKRGKWLVDDLNISEGENVLDIGCGTGLLAEYVADIVGSDGSVTGIDPLPLRIDIARRKVRANLDFRVGNAYDLSVFPENHFDTVYLNAVFHWLGEKEQPLQQIHRVLKPGGHLGLNSGSKDHPFHLEKIRNRVLSKPPYNAFSESLSRFPHLVSVPELVWLLDRNQFSINKVEVQNNIFTLANPEDAIDLSHSSSFANFIGHLPEALRDSAMDEIKQELERLRTAEGIRLEGHRIVAIAAKK
jgi:arsenite methyltransferase